MYLGSWAIDDYLTLSCTTNGTDGAAAAADGNVVLNIYEDDGTTQIIGPVNATKSFDSIVGLNVYKQQLTAAAGFEQGKTYTAVFTATVGGVAGLTTRTFQIAADVTATATVNGTVDANLTQVAGVAVATHAAGMVPADVRDYLGNACPAADTAGYPKVTIKSGLGTGELNLSGGAGDSNVTKWGGSSAGTLETTQGFWTYTTRELSGPTNITSDDGKILNAAATGVTVNPASHVASVTGAVGSVAGNVTGSVGSVTGAVGSVTGAVGSVTGSVGSVAGNVAGNVVGSVGSVATDGINANSMSAAAAIKVADEILNRDLSAGTDSGSASVRTVRQSLRSNRNRAEIVGDRITVYKEDDTTIAWTGTVTRAAVNPVTGIDPD